MLIAAVCLAPATLVPAPPVLARPANFATQYPDTGGCASGYDCYADSATHTWDYDLGPRLTTAVVESLYGSYDTTALTVSLSGAGNNNSHGASVDVYFEFGEVPGGDDAFWDCRVYVGRVCKHAHVTFDGSRVASNSDDELKSLACHEIGHSVGLLHGEFHRHEDPEHTDYACMTKLPSSSLMGLHNVRHVNAHYA